MTTSAHDGTAAERVSLVPERPLDLRRTLAPLRGSGTLRFAGDGIWRTTRSPEGPATLHLLARRPVATPADLHAPVEAEAWGPGRHWVLAQLPELLGWEDDPAGYLPHHPVLAERHRRSPGIRLGATRRVLETLLPTIVAQKVPSVDAGRSWRSLSASVAERAPGPAALSLPPDPGRLASLAYHDLHRFGIERKRSAPLLAACRAAERLERLARRPGEDLRAGLRQIPGIGPWTASVVEGIVQGPADHVVVGDYGIPAMVSWTLARERTADDGRMLRLLEPERPHRARAVRLVLGGGESPPRRGPRLGPQAVAWL